MKNKNIMFAAMLLFAVGFGTSAYGLCERPLRYELYQCKPHWRLSDTAVTPREHFGT